MKRTIGYFSFTSEEERKSKEALYEQVELDKLYAGNGEDSFFEFFNTVLNDDDTLLFLLLLILATSLCRCYTHWTISSTVTSM